MRDMNPGALSASSKTPGEGKLQATPATSELGDSAIQAAARPGNEAAHPRFAMLSDRDQDRIVDAAQGALDRFGAARFEADVLRAQAAFHYSRTTLYAD